MPRPGRQGMQALNATSSRNQPSSVPEQSVIAVNAIPRVWPPHPLCKREQKPERSTVVCVKPAEPPVQTGRPKVPSGAHEESIVPS